MEDKECTINMRLPKRFSNVKNLIIHVSKPEPKKRITNADRIRNMTDEELAKFMETVTCESHGWCDDCTSMRGEYCHGINDESNSLVQERLKWLKEEVVTNDRVKSSRKV